MAEKYWFFNSAPGDPRTYQASDFAQYFKNTFYSGVIKGDGNSLKVSSTGASMTVDVRRGSAIIEGHMYENDSTLSVPVDLPETSTNRIDRIVLRLDLNNANRYIRIFSKRGTASYPPPLQRDSQVYELSLAQILLTANTAAVSPANITDERTDPTVCGFASVIAEGATSTKAGLMTADSFNKLTNAQLHKLTKDDGRGLEIVTDYDQAQKSGFYYAVTGTPNAPETTHGWFIQVIRHPDDTSITQIAYSNTTKPSMYIRNSTNSLTWRPWVNVMEGLSTDWVNLTLQSGAQAFGSASTPKYKRIGNLVVLRGAVKFSSNISNATTIATLPSGFRPLDTSFAISLPTTIRTNFLNRSARWVIEPGGAIMLEAVTDGSYQANEWLPISCVFPIS